MARGKGKTAFGGGKQIKNFKEYCSIRGCVSPCKPVMLYSETGKKKGTHWVCENNHYERTYIRKPL